MIKLMIAEDEYLERKAINYFLEKYYSAEIEVIAEVANGKEALSQAIKNQIDIILMDIKMPKLDGLKSAELIKEVHSETEIIILTAHSEFDYAKKSIHIGVSDYLVKPHLEEEFRAVLDKTIEKVKFKKKRKVRQNELKNKLNELTPILEKEIILEIIYGTKSSLEKFVEHKKLLGFKSNKFMCLIIGSPEDSIFSEDLLYKVKNKINRLIDEVIAYIGLQDMVFLLLGDNLAEIRESKEFKNLLLDIKGDFRHNYHNDILIAQSQVYNNDVMLYQSYNEAKSMLSTGEDIFKSPYQQEKIICGKIIDRDLEGAIREFNNMFALLVKNSHSNIDALKDYLKEFSILLNRNIKDFFGTELEIYNTRLVEKNFASLEEIYNIKIFMQNLLKKIVNKIVEYKKDKKHQVIDTVKGYIMEHYNDDISLSEMAEYISFSQYYLSKLFKEVEGINFKDYVIYVRMEKAKELLKKGQKIRTIADSVGYSDPNYFSRAFKKYTGISPSKYI